ncbi:MAG TPA: multicopper oxidase family protein [Chitinophagaceae bacterium]|nr:multicopper oxidase family protein [Chitinophagaceae bacterium]
MQPATHYYQLTASEFDWKISEHKSIRAWGFNNTLPGPLLKARKGDTLVIKVKNELPEPTIVHWHGIRLPAAMDGTGEVQPPIAPGEEFEYRFEVPDAGTFWYHSHHNETVQMERGMYGALIVEEDTELVTDADSTWIIDDMKLTKQNEFKKGGLVGRWMERHDGREGDTLLINGKENLHIKMNAGQTERWRFVNASSARYFRLFLAGKPFKIIGTDGGFLESPVQTTEALITPGERLEILVGPFNKGDSFAIESLPYNRMTFVKSKHRRFATVTVGNLQPTLAFIPTSLRTIEPLATHAVAVNRRVKFSVAPSLKHGIDFHVNGDVHTMDAPVYTGELQVWEVSNTSLMDHPFHLHGFFFQVLEENGKAPAYKAWKDTYNLKPRSTIKIAWMPDRTGSWMYHCHIIEHHQAGMMGHFEVMERGVQANKAAQKPSCHHAHH